MHTVLFMWNVWFLHLMIIIVFLPSPITETSLHIYHFVLFGWFWVILTVQWFPSKFFFSTLHACMMSLQGISAILYHIVLFFYAVQIKKYLALDFYRISLLYENSKFTSNWLEIVLAFHSLGAPLFTWYTGIFYFTISIIYTIEFMILIFNLCDSIAHLDEWFKEEHLSSHMSRQ